MTLWVDRMSLEQSLADQGELLRELNHLFRQLHPALERGLELAVSSNDFLEIRELAHVLKTRLRYLHCFSLGDVAEAMEAMAVRNQSQEMQSTFVGLKQGIREAIAELHQLLSENPS